MSVNRSNYKQGTCFAPTKKRFGDEETAAKHAAKIEDKRGTPMRVYACGNHFHLATRRR